MVTAKLQIINGVGPEWFPTTLRNKLTKFSLTFFDADSWEHHDEAYTKGGGLYSKFKADFIFLFEMLASASKRKYPARAVGYFLAWIYFLLVFMFGSSAYNFTTILITQEDLDL
jgi:hypothetical protein